MLWLLLFACDKADDTDPSPPECDGVTWETHGEAFVAVCTGCHSAALAGADRQGAPEPLNFDPPGGVEGFANQMVALGTGDNPPMPPGGLDEDVRSRFASWVECGLPGLPAGCVGDTYTGDLVVSEAPPDFCEQTRWVTGDLVVDADPRPIACLCGVGGDVVATETSLVLLDLQRVDGSIRLESSALEAVVLPSLRQVGGPLVVAGNSAMLRLDVRELESAAGIRVRDNDVLEALDLGALTSSGGAVVVRNNPSLMSLDVHGLLAAPGPVDVHGNPQLAELALPNGLVELENSIDIVDNPDLPSIDGFAGLERVGGAVNLVDLRPDDIEVFPALTSVGSVQLVDLGTLGRLHAFEALETVDGTVRVSDLAGVGDLSLFPVVRHIRGGLVIDGFAGQSVVGFPALVAVEGGIEISYNDLLTEVRFPSLVTAGSVDVHHDPSLVDLSGFAALTRVEGNVVIMDNTALTSLDGLESLTVVGALRLEDLPALTDLSGLANLEEIQGNLRVRRLGAFEVAELEALFATVNVLGTISIE